MADLRPRLIVICKFKIGCSWCRDYYQLTKPGIIYGNILTATAGFLLAAQGHIGVGLLAATLIGLASIIGAACVFNNYIDRNIDRQMARTKQRALVAGTISGSQALIFATGLTVIGSTLLAIYVNILTLLVALFGMLFYIVLYGIGKRRTVHGTLIGAVSGAVPPVIGYVAVTGHIDTAAGLLFAIMVFWQMPHFYAIALFRTKDYRAANLPVLPVVAGPQVTKKQILIYVIAYGISTSLLFFYGYVGFVYLCGMLAAAVGWLLAGMRSYNSLSDDQWGRQMFINSLYVIVAWSGLLATASWLV